MEMDRDKLAPPKSGKFAVRASRVELQGCEVTSSKVA